MSVLPEVVVGPRLVLRRWRVRDMEILRDAIQESIDHLRPWMSWIEFEPLSDREREALIRTWGKDWIAGEEVVFGAFFGDQVVGGCGFHRRAGPNTLEIGYWVHVDHLRKGYATEMARILTSAAFTVPGIERVEIHHDKANTRSGAIPEALGFNLDGESQVKPHAPATIGIDVAWSMSKRRWQSINTTLDG
ncbi:GNAT family N-acetyltransferase [Candidatus Poriferisocius sp.]|uniref:GNAT family N-acetyltransferase n=1 Tax=Candidatus Poriferisocius sp. TaxID=3101276 RepID=UPI003B02BD2E